MVSPYQTLDNGQHGESANESTTDSPPSGPTAMSARGTSSSFLQPSDSVASSPAARNCNSTMMGGPTASDHSASASRPSADELPANSKSPPSERLNGQRHHSQAPTSPPPVHNNHHNLTATAVFSINNHHHHTNQQQQLGAVPDEVIVVSSSASSCSSSSSSSSSSAPLSPASSHPSRLSSVPAQPPDGVPSAMAGDVSTVAPQPPPQASGTGVASGSGARVPSINHLHRHESLQSAFSSSSYASGSSSAASSPTSGPDEPAAAFARQHAAHKHHGNHVNHNHHHGSSPTSTTAGDPSDLDTRKVEPLKINLQQREPIKTVIKLSGTGNAFDASASVLLLPTSSGTTITPKITIKPIPKPPSSIASDDDVDNSGNSLLLRCVDSSPPGAHIVPKLTIRTANCSGSAGGAQSEIVPKLTIAYGSLTAPANDDEICSHDSDASSGVDQQPPIPRMTIKSNEIIVMNNSNHIAAPTTPSSRNQATHSSPALADQQLLNVSPSVPKIKIKQKFNPEESTAATFTISRSSDDDDSPIKQPPPGNVAHNSAVPKLLVRVPKDSCDDDVTASASNDSSIVIPKVTIRPVIDPAAPSDGQSLVAPLVTPKITIKPIPRPDASTSADLMKPLEVNTSTEFVSSIPAELSAPNSSGQQSPRIILKINKTHKEQPTPTTPSSSTSNCVDSPEPSADLKRTFSNASGPDAKRLRLDNATTPPPVQPPQSVQKAESKLKEILSRMSSPPSASASALTSPDAASSSESVGTITPRRYQTNSSVRRAIRPPPSMQSDNAIQLPPEMERAASMFSEEPITKPVRLHPLLLQDIERAKVLEAMMRASAEAEAKKTLAKTLHCAEVGGGSSSDCIILEDSNKSSAEPVSAHPFASVGASRANGPSDQDSGVDVSGSTTNSSSSSSIGIGSVQTANDTSTATPAKRPRGRPRKEASAEVLSAKKLKEERQSKRRFMGLPATERKTPGRKRKNAAVAPDTPAAVAEVVDLTSTNSNAAASESSQLLSSSNNNSNTCTSNPATEKDLPATSTTSGQAGNASETAVELPVLVTPAKVVRRRRIRIDDDDESPTFNPLGCRTGSATRARGRARTGRGRGGSRISGVQRTVRGVAVPSTPPASEAAETDPPQNQTGTDSGQPEVSAFGILSPGKAPGAPALDGENVFVSPDDKMFTSPPDGKNQRKQIFRAANAFQPNAADSDLLPVATDDDTQMSASDGLQTPLRLAEHLLNEDSQTSVNSSSTSFSVAANSSESVAAGSQAGKKRCKIEVSDPEGKTEFTVDMIAEYDWPPPKGCCPSRQRDTFMIQEQVAEYLGVKSFKRKYPDLPRRMVEMEERNYLSEKGLVSEKMCDLGLTAVMASDILDIMHNDFFEKYDEYKKYLRIKHIRQLSTTRTKIHIMEEAAERNLSAREHALHATASWNRDFNRERIDERRQFMDMQTFVVHHPASDRRRMTTKEAASRPPPSHYPIALVPGQFQEYYRKFSPAELLCYPINSILANSWDLDEKLRNMSAHEYAELDSDSSGSSSSDSDDDDDTTSDSDSDSDFDSSDSSDSDREPVPQQAATSRLATALMSTKKCTAAGSGASASAPLKSAMAGTTYPKAAAAAASAVPSKPDSSLCRVCERPQNVNRDNKPEVFVMCSTCRRRAHPSCIEMPPRMSVRVQDYNWQCSECKHCWECRQNTNEDKMLFCDQCDRGYHIYCIGLTGVPEGRWHCSICSICTLCGTRSPEGHKNPNLTAKQRQRLASTAKWSHEYRISHVSNLREHSAMLCTPCAQQQRTAEALTGAGEPNAFGANGGGSPTISSPTFRSPASSPSLQQHAMLSPGNPASPAFGGPT